jgi:glycosyltransferase involved in cell wall biosynthesis
MKNNMKKLIIGITAEGSVNLLLGQPQYFHEQGYQTYLMGPLSERSAAFCRNENCEHLIIDIEREISPWKDLKSLWEIYLIFRKIKPDIVNLGTPKVSLLGMIAAFAVGVPKRIYTCRGFRFEHESGAKRKILIAMEKITSFFAHDVICISNSVEKLGLKHQIFKKEKAIVIHKGSSNGVNLSLFNLNELKYQNVKHELQHKFNLKDKFVFGFLGRIVDRKGINELYSVFCTLYETNKNLRLLLVGPFEMSQIADQFLIEKIDQHPGIINYGRVKQEDVPGYLLAMDVFVLPAWWEGFGNVLVQAAAMGLPTISTTGTGTCDAVSHGFNGLLIEPKSENQLHEAMETLYTNKELSQQFAKNGLVWAKNFDREIIWEGLDSIYKS